MPLTLSSRWYLYLLRTATGVLYTGITTDVARRLAQHQAGDGAKALRGKGPLVLVYQGAVGDRSTALKIEYRIKRWRRAQKERLVIDQPVLLDVYLAAISTKNALKSDQTARSN